MMSFSVKSKEFRISMVSIMAMYWAQEVASHGYIKAWSADDGRTWTLGQKQKLATSSIRGFSQNTGWIGSKFLTSPAMVCSSGLTPSLKIVAPSGDLFSRADQSAGKTLAVQSGATVRLLINDEPHKIYPHENGHIQVYLGFCGPTETSCENFDAATISYFKILSLKQGLASKKEFPYNKHKDGNVVKVPISDTLPMGSYIMRVELIVFGQSSEAEGKQDQYYVTCGQMALAAPKSSAPASLESLESVRFPGAYKNGNIDPEGEPPGPAVVKFSMEGDGAGAAPSVRQTSAVAPAATPGEDHALLFSDKAAPACARTCLATKISENARGMLGRPCVSTTPEPDQHTCQCQDEKFVEAFSSCASDHCQPGCDLQNALNSFSALCGLKTEPVTTSKCHTNRKRGRPFRSI